MTPTFLPAPPSVVADVARERLARPARWSATSAKRQLPGRVGRAPSSRASACPAASRQLTAVRLASTPSGTMAKKLPLHSASLHAATPPSAVSLWSTLLSSTLAAVDAARLVHVVLPCRAARRTPAATIGASDAAEPGDDADADRVGTDARGRRGRGLAGGGGCGGRAVLASRGPAARRGRSEPRATCRNRQPGDRVDHRGSRRASSNPRPAGDGSTATVTSGNRRPVARRRHRTRGQRSE